MDLVNQALASKNEVSKLVLKNKEKEDEKDNSFQAQFKSAVKSQQTKNLSEKTYGELTPSQIDSARMSEVSYINLVDGPHSAQKYATMHLPNYEWDKLRSTEHISVFVNKKTGKVRLGFRGTQTAVDWKMNGRTFLGTLSQSSQIKEMDKTINEIFDFYGRDKNGKQTMVELMSGHSKGGSGAFYFGEKYSVDTHLQDPAISVNEIIGGKTKANHHVAKTPNDAVSALSNIAVFRKGITTTDLRQQKAGFLNAHALSIMSGTNYKKTGNTVYNPKLKSQAFLLQQLNEGKSSEQIVKETGYSSKESQQELREEIKAIQSTPEIHEKVLKESGFIVEKSTTVSGKVKASIGEFVVPKVDAALGQAVDRVAKVASAGGIAGILSSVGASQALAAIGSNNEVVNEGIIGSVSNASQDAAAKAYAHIRNRGHHVPVTNALKALPNGNIDSLLAESTSTAERTVEQVASSARMASIGARALTSLAKGGAGGVLGAGVQIGTQAVLQQLGMDEHTAHQISRLAGAVAAGALFGPQAMAVFVAIEAMTIAFEEIWNFFSPSTPEKSPFQIAQEEAEKEVERLREEEDEILENPLTDAATVQAINQRRSDPTALTYDEFFTSLNEEPTASGYTYDPDAVISLFPSTPPPPSPALPTLTGQIPFSEMTPEQQSEFIDQSITKNRENNISNQPGYDQFADYDSDDYYDEDVDSDDYEDYDSDAVDEVVEEEVIEESVVAPITDLTTPHIYSVRQVILNAINKDEKIKGLRLSGDSHGVNKAIRELYMKNQHLSEYNDAIEYGDPSVPQLTPNNELIYQSINKPAPTIEMAKQENKNI